MAKSRKSARQRRRNQRPATRPAVQPTPMPAAPEAEAEEQSTVATLPAPARGVAASRPSSSGSSQRGSRANPRLTVAGPSRLSERAIEEYHYVGRDLRNIGRLIVVMAVLLAIAFVAFTALGIGTTA